MRETPGRWPSWWIVPIAALLLTGCMGSGADDRGVQVDDGPLRILVTSQMGTQVHLDEQVNVGPETSVLDALRHIAEVETAHDDGFVVSIDGRKGGPGDEKTDWFYHLDGRLASTGAADWQAVQASLVVWDLRPWNHTMTLPYLLNGLPWPAHNPLLDPQGLAEHEGSPHLFVQTNGPELVILDAWRIPHTTVSEPWLVAHVVKQEEEPALLLAASDHEAESFISRIEQVPPQGLGVVVTPDEVHTIPAS